MSALLTQLCWGRRGTYVWLMQKLSSVRSLLAFNPWRDCMSFDVSWRTYHYQQFLLFQHQNIFGKHTYTQWDAAHTTHLERASCSGWNVFLPFCTYFFLQMRKRGKVLLFIVENSIFSWKSFSDRCWGCFNMFYLFKRALLISIFLCSTHKRVPARGYST